MVPLASEYAVRYDDLVARQRAAVRDASGGRLGYLHMPGMMARGWAESTGTCTPSSGELA